MILSNLLKELSEFNMNEEVQIIVPVGCCGETEALQIDLVDNICGLPYIYTNLFPLLTSCRQLGNADCRSSRSIKHSLQYINKLIQEDKVTKREIGQYLQRLQELLP